MLFPWGWTATHSPNDTQLRTLGRKFGYYTGYTVCQSGEPGCIYQTDGTTDDWAYGELGVAAYTFELGTRFFESCSSFQNWVLPPTLRALVYAAKAARQPYTSPGGPEVIMATGQPTQAVAGDALTVTVTVDGRRYATNDWRFGDEPVRTVAMARLTVDAPGWITGATPTMMTAADGLFDTAVETATITLDTTGWSLGRHLVFVEGQNGDGRWGVPSAAFVDIASSTPPIIENPLPRNAADPGRIHRGPMWSRHPQMKPIRPRNAATPTR